VKNLKVGEFREGCSVSRTSDGTLLDVGVEQPALLLGEQMPMNKRTTVKVADIANRVRVEWANRDEITDYWGYTVNVERRSFGNLLKSRNFDLTIATSKYGSPFAEQSDLIRTEWRRSHAVLVMFGSPTRGLHEIAKSEGTVLEKIVDFVVNTIPSQGTETVRTEEALLSTLAIFNLYFHA
jgi:predicted SPOUT superfamily RNA methylase MTH1